MSAIAIVILLVVGLPILAVAVWVLLGEARVRIESGTVGLLIVRGVASRSLEPGVHYVFPYRHQLIQIYPLRDLVYLTVDGEQPEAADFSDPPLTLHLGDRTSARVSYTVRFRVSPDGLKTVHELVGPDGLKALVRDRSRHVLVEALGDPAVGYDIAFGAARAQIESGLAERLGAILRDDGLEATLFSLRAIDIGAVDETVQDTVRWRAALEREQAAAAVRAARVRNEIELQPDLASVLDDDVLRYRMIEVWREVIARWDGTGLAPTPKADAVEAQPQATTEETSAAGEHSA